MRTILCPTGFFICSVSASFSEAVTQDAVICTAAFVEVARRGSIQVSFSLPKSHRSSSFYILAVVYGSSLVPLSCLRL